MNRLKASILLATLTALVVWAGPLAGGTIAMVLALAFAGVMNLGAWWSTDRLVLRLYGAREISEAADPEPYGVVRALALRARLLRLLSAHPSTGARVARRLAMEREELALTRA
jgi:heat shock protein HtpX